MDDRYPVVYVRGYAGGPAGIDTAVDDAFYGFNKGSTVVRVGGDGEPLFHQFESPLLRLMIDEGYDLIVRGDQHATLQRARANSLDPASIWVYRFYDLHSRTFGGANPDVFDLRAAALGLYDFIELIRDRVHGRPPVYLVAHSMGGLVCRSMLQTVCGTPREDGAVRDAGPDTVAKLLTMGTPHGGIETRFALADLLNEHVGIFGSEMFARANMHEFLAPAAQDTGDYDPQVMPEEALPSDRAFCVVGTNPSDYGLARKAIGVKSDGLVRIENAYVKGAPRAFVHRAHSGSYGLVNSEEAYQNLRRFLFAKWRVRVHLVGVDFTHEDSLAGLSLEQLRQRLARLEGGAEFDRPDLDSFWQADVQVTVRGLPVILHEQSVDKHCPIQLTEEQLRRRIAALTAGADLTDTDTADTPVPLASVYLLGKARFNRDRSRASSTTHPGPVPRDPRAAPDSGLSRYALRMRVFRLTETGGFLGMGGHLEQVADWEDSLIVDVGPAGDDGLVAWARWASEIPGPNASYDPSGTPPLDFPGWVAEVPLPRAARDGVLGDRARLRLEITEA
ncbi:esterase/lipase family protein [Demequina pelophila]|uniref:esterase/lipase family protein n=1 Tax=Demequina pelophila TaxID=1638984 RepID=UPI00078362D7|nr:hypothetical protein [Demequina pelophila]